MQAIRRTDTAPELAVRKMLFASGRRFRVDWPLPFDRRRRADIAFTRKRVLVFIDGCFWHRCPRHYVPPRTNSTYWDSKTRGNANRDAETTRLLTDLDWTVLRFWAHEPSDEIVFQIEKALRDKEAPLVAKQTTGCRNPTLG